MKLKEKEQARNLRKEGYSLKQISQQLKVSKGSVSVWVRDVKLSDDLIKKLVNTRFGNTYTRDYFKKIREKYQQEGRELIKDCDKNFVAGLMLYWGEGRKGKNAINLSNSDPDLLKFFLIFLKTYFNVQKKDITFNFQWYSGNGLTQEEVKNFWLKKLDLEESNLRKAYIDYRPTLNLGRKTGKCLYGVGRININSTEILHKIYGAIQEFAGFEHAKWLF